MPSTSMSIDIDIGFGGIHVRSVRPENVHFHVQRDDGHWYNINLSELPSSARPSSGSTEYYGQRQQSGWAEEEQSWQDFARYMQDHGRRTEPEVRRAAEEGHRAAEEGRRAAEQARRDAEQARRAAEQGRHTAEGSRRSQAEARWAQERARRAEEQQRAQEQQRTQERAHRAEEQRLRDAAKARQQNLARSVRTQLIRQAWARYEKAPPPHSLTFSTIAWPIASIPRDISSLTREAIREFILSDVHSIGASPRARVQAALRRWHPDKFVPAMMHRVEPKQRGTIEEAVRIVAGHLNDILRDVASEQR